MILFVGLTLGKRRVDGALVVEMTGKLLDIIAHENITLTQWLLKTDAFETGTAGQGNIRLSARKDTTREINLHLVEGEALTLMNRYCPRQTDGVLLVSANLFLLNLLLNLIEMVSHIAPCRRLNHHILSFLGAHINLGILILIKTDDGAQRAIHPLVLDIILDEDNLSPCLEVKFDRGRETALRKLALYVATEEARLARKTLELAVVDVIYRIAARREGDGKFGITFIEPGSHALVEALEILHRHLRRADMVEDADENRIALAVYLLEFDAHEFEVFEHLGIEEETAAVEGTEQTTVVFPHHRLQLEDIAHQKQLLAPERLSHVAAIYPQYLVQEIDDIGTNHTDLIDDDELYLADNLYLL